MAMEILKGMVRDEGYPDVECTYAKIDDKAMYYFIQGGELPNGNIIASTILKEAIGHAPYTSLGLINRNGEVLIPFENKNIKQVKDNLLLVEKNVPTTQSVIDDFNNKSDPLNITSLLEKATMIKKQMIEIMGMDGDFVFDNQFSEAALYTMDGLNVGNGYYSFISEKNSKYYFSTNVMNGQIIKFDPDSLEQNKIDEQQTVENNNIINEQPIPENNIMNEQTENDEPEQQVDEFSDNQQVETEEAIQNNENTELKLNIAEEITEEPSTEQSETNELEQQTEENNILNEEEQTYTEDTQIEEDNNINNFKQEDNNQTTSEDIQNPTILNATNTIKKLLEENRGQRQIIDKQSGELEVYKSRIIIFEEDNKSKDLEISSLRKELNNYRSQAITASRENIKMKSTLARLEEISNRLEEENRSLREQVAGIHALGNAVAEANVLIQPLEENIIYNDFNQYNPQSDANEITYSSLSQSDDDNYQKTIAA